MRKAILSLMATFVVLGIVSAGHAYAANLGEFYWKDDYKDNGKHVRIWYNGVVNTIDRDTLEYRQSRTFTGTINGNTLTVTGELWEGDGNNLVIYVSTPNAKSDKYKEIYVEKQFTGTSFSVDVDISICNDFGQADVGFIISGGTGESLSQNFTTFYNLSLVNGSWKFTGKQDQDHNRFMFDESALYTPVYWAYMDESMTERMLWDSAKLNPIKAKVDQLTAGITDDYVKAFVMYDWVTHTFQYGGGPAVDGIEAPIKCQDFMDLIDDMMYYARIPCLNVGAWYNNGPHGHNRAFIDGRWVLMDGVAWQGGMFDVSLDHYSFDYKLMGNATTKSDQMFKKPEEKPANAVDVKHNVVTFNVNGYPMPRSVGAYNIKGNNFIKLRDLAVLMNTTSKKFSVNWDNGAQAIKMKTGEKYTEVGGELYIDYEANKPSPLKTPPYGLKSNASIYLNGKQLNLEVYTIMGNNYFKLRDIAQAMNFGVSYDNNTKMITLNASKAYTK